jgi:hypothetical protein
MSDTTPAVAPAAPSTTTTAAEGGAPLASLQQGAPPEAAAPKDKGATLTGEPAWKKQINDLVERAEKARAEKEAKAAPPPEPEGLKEGESWDSIYASQPPEVQRAMAEMRKMVTRKTQELAAEKKAIEAQRKALVAPEIAKALEAPPLAGEVDPFDPKSLSAHIEAEVKRRLAEVLEPVRKQSQQAEAQQRYESFMAEHPDLSADKALRTEVAALLKQNAALDLSTAYYAVKGRRSRAAEAEAAKRVALESRAAQRAALNVSTGPRVAGGRVEPSIDPKASAWEIYQTLAKARSV